MSRKNLSLAILVALVSLLAAGAILASNMGFKINYPLRKTTAGVSKSGTNSLALPYIRRSGLTTSQDFLNQIEGHGPPGPYTKVFSIAKFLPSSDSLQVYHCCLGSPGPNFQFFPGEGYRVQMLQDMNYVIVGVHDPSVVVNLSAQGAGSKSGTNDYAPPYNSSAATAYDLMKDIEGPSAPPFTKVRSVGRFLIATDSLQLYTGRMGSPGANFALTPGESYRIQMQQTVPYVPSHY